MTSNIDVTKFLAEISGISVPSSTEARPAPFPVDPNNCLCGQPKMKGDRALYCEYHSRQGSLVYQHLPNEHRAWKQALSERNPVAHTTIQAKLMMAMGGEDVYDAAMNSAPRRRPPGQVAARSQLAGAGLMTATQPVAVTGAVHAASLVAKLDAAIMALADLRQDLARIRDGI